MAAKNLLKFLLHAVRRQRRLGHRSRAMGRAVEHLQAGEVLPRIQQAIGMVNAQSGNQLLRQQAADKLMGGSKNARIFHAQPHQIVDVEKSAVIDLLGRDFPMGQAVRLRFQQPMQAIVAAAAARAAVAARNRRLHITPHAVTVPHQIAQPRDQPWQAGAPQQCRFRVGIPVRGQFIELRQQSAQLAQFGLRRQNLVLSGGVGHWPRPGGKHQGIGLRIDRKAALVVLHRKFAVRLQVHQFELAALQLFAILRRQYRQQHFVVHLFFQRRPVNVEVAGEFRSLAVFQNILPPLVVVADADVIGHQVEDQAHAALFQRARQTAQIPFAAQLRIKLIVVGDVVAMRASGARLQDGRDIKMGDAQGVQIRQQPLRIGKAEIGAQL